MIITNINKATFLSKTARPYMKMCLHFHHHEMNLTGGEHASHNTSPSQCWRGGYECSAQSSCSLQNNILNWVPSFVAAVSKGIQKDTETSIWIKMKNQQQILLSTVDPWTTGGLNCMGLCIHGSYIYMNTAQCL